MTTRGKWIIGLVAVAEAMVLAAIVAGILLWRRAPAPEAAPAPSGPGPASPSFGEASWPIWRGDPALRGRAA